MKMLLVVKIQCRQVICLTNIKIICPAFIALMLIAEDDKFIFSDINLYRFNAVLFVSCLGDAASLLAIQVSGFFKRYCKIFRIG